MDTCEAVCRKPSKLYRHCPTDYDRMSGITRHSRTITTHVTTRVQQAKTGTCRTMMFSRLEVEETAPRSRYHGLRPSLEAVLTIFISLTNGLGVV